MAHFVAISSGPIIRPQDSHPFTKGEVIMVNGDWAVMLPDFPEAFEPKADMVGFIEREMQFELHCKYSSLRKMDKVVVEIRSDKEKEIVQPLTEILLPEKAIWVLSGDAGREVTQKLIEHGHRRSTIIYDSEDARRKRKALDMPADVYFLIEGLMLSLGKKPAGVVEYAESRR